MASMPSKQPGTNEYVAIALPEKHPEGGVLSSSEFSIERNQAAQVPPANNLARVAGSALPVAF